MPINRIVSIDPGTKYIGVATRINGMYACYEFGTRQQLYAFLRLGEWDLVICEDFKAVHIGHYGLETVKIVGGVEAICIERKIPMACKMNHQRMQFLKNGEASLKVKSILGYNIRDHMTDAMAHLMSWERDEHTK